MIQGKHIVIITRSHCPPCDSLKDALDLENIPYRAFNPEIKNESEELKKINDTMIGTVRAAPTIFLMEGGIVKKMMTGSGDGIVNACREHAPPQPGGAKSERKAAAP